MDRNLAETYLTDWGIWSGPTMRQGGCSQQAWQREMPSGYAEEPEPGSQSVSLSDDVLMLVDATVSRVCQKFPYMGQVLKSKYLKQRHIDSETLDTALLRFVGEWSCIG